MLRRRINPTLPLREGQTGAARLGRGKRGTSAHNRQHAKHSVSSRGPPLKSRWPGTHWFSQQERWYAASATLSPPAPWGVRGVSRERTQRSGGPLRASNALSPAKGCQTAASRLGRGKRGTSAYNRSRAICRQRRTPPRKIFRFARIFRPAPKGRVGRKEPAPTPQCHPGASRDPWAARQTQAQRCRPTLPLGRVKPLQAVWGGGLHYRQKARSRLCAELPRLPLPEICSLTLTNFRPSPKGRVGRKEPSPTPQCHPGALSRRRPGTPGTMGGAANAGATQSSSINSKPKPSWPALGGPSTSFFSSFSCRQRRG